MKIPISSADEPDDKPEAAAPPTETAEQLPAKPIADQSAPAAEVPAEVRVQELEAALAKVARDHAAAQEQLLRLKAEFDNYRKRMLRQFDEVKRYAATELVADLLPGLDNLERALHAARQDATPASAQIAEGVGMVLKQFKEALARVGVQELQAQGEVFDPTRHEAIEVVPVPPHQDGRIVEEVQRGYMVHDRLLRPAKVVVGKAAPDASHGGT
jgi:molecular chaperone GrpE